MKAKVKFNPAKLKDTLLQKGEKIAFGLAVCICLLLAYKAWGRTGLDQQKQPDKLLEKARQASQHLEGSQPPQFPLPKVQVSVGDVANPEVVGSPILINPPVVDPKGKRPDPVILPPLELQVSGGRGLIAFARDKQPGGLGRSAALSKTPEAESSDSKRDRGKKDSEKDKRDTNHVELQSVPLPGDRENVGFRPSANSDLQAKYWAVVTGLVPNLRQNLEFQKAFLNTLQDSAKRSGDDEVPVYLGYRIERAEVASSAAAPLNWTALKIMDSRSLKALRTEWAGEVSEIVEDIFADDPIVTTPLPPLVGIKWGEAAAHPKIPLKASKDLAASTQIEASAPNKPAESAEPAAGEFAAPQDRQDALINQPSGKLPGGSVGGKQITEYKLLRYFDFTAEPGKRYRYRFKFVVQNPNQGKEPRVLKNPDSASKPFIESEWSDPTPEVSIPRGERVLAGPAKPTRSAEEPSATIVVATLDSEHGVEAATEETVRRGSVANYKKLTATGIDWSQPAVVTLENVQFKTDAVIMDIRGGKPISTKDKSLTEPGELLVLRGDGSVAILNELEDVTAYHDALPPKEMKDKKDPLDKPETSKGGSSRAKQPKKTLSELKTERQQQRATTPKSKRSAGG